MMELKTKFSSEPFSLDFYEKNLKLFADHVTETSRLFEKMHPDLQFFLKAQELGILRVFTARSVFDNELVAYQFFIIGPHPLNFLAVIASEMLFFVKKPRRLSLGPQFLNYCDDKLKGEGVNFVSRAVPTGKKRRRAMGRFGYREIETTYVRFLNGSSGSGIRFGDFPGGGN